MKKTFTLLNILLITLTIQGQKRDVKYKLDPFGKKTNKSFMSLASQYPDNAMAFRITADSGRVYQFNAPKYAAYKVNYVNFREKLEDITGRKLSDSTIFIINYNYKDDVCSDSYSNVLTDEMIASKKNYFDIHKTFIEKTYKNTMFICLFETGITLSKKGHTEEEYFFTDLNHFFRKNIFLNTIVCGSDAIIRPEGLVLVHNGESRPDWIANHLNSDIWNSLFQTN